RAYAARPDRGCFGCEHFVGGGLYHRPRGKTILGEVRLAGRGKGDLMSKVIVHADGLARCPWPKRDPLYVAYHDDEWGVPEFDDRALFEKLMLDGFQAGLSWITILRKREAFRAAFDGFDPDIIARYDARKLRSLMQDEKIVRNRAKIEASVGNARAYLAIRERQRFADYLW